MRRVPELIKCPFKPRAFPSLALEKRQGSLGSGGYLLKADGQHLSHKIGPFTHGDGDSCKPMMETGEGGWTSFDFPFTFLWAISSQHLGLLGNYS